MYSVLLVLVFLIGNIFITGEAVIEEYLKPTVDPCDDFYQYACGNWKKANTSLRTSDTLSLLDATINDKISELLDSRQEHQEVLEKARTFYEPCKNLKPYDMGSFLKAMQPKNMWTVSNSWNAAEFSWFETVAELRKYGVRAFIDMNIMPRWDNSSVNIIYLDVMKFQASTKKSIETLFRRASLNLSLFEEFNLFEKQLALIWPNVADSSEFETKEETVDYLGKTLPQINWMKYFSTVFEHEIDLNTAIAIRNIDLISKLINLLKKTQPEVVSNYILIKFLQFLDEFSIEYVGPRECVRALHQAMPLAIDHIIENHFYEDDYDQVAQDLFNYIKIEFLAEVSKLYEKQPSVLMFIYTKTSVMEIQIGNSDRNMTSEAVAKYYKDLKFNKENFYLNLLKAFNFKVEKEFEMLKGKDIKIAYLWTVSPSPFYLQAKNMIVVPLTLLQERVFDKHEAKKYSVLGFIIGHEFLHGFDLVGVNYDYKGTVVESALSCNPSFFEQIECIDDVDGVSGIGEKIADIGGIRLAYDAFQRSLMQNGMSVLDKADIRTDGRTLGQKFFIDFAQFFCERSEEPSKTKWFQEVHDADDLRVKRALMNFDKFAKTFECPVGSAMNPERKCRVW